MADNLEVKEVRVCARCYVVCRNPWEAQKNAAARAAIRDKLTRQVEKQGPKAVIGNRGLTRFLKMAQGSVVLDEAAVPREARLDGKFVLTTNNNLLVVFCQPQRPVLIPFTMSDYHLALSSRYAPPEGLRPRWPGARC